MTLSPINSEPNVIMQIQEQLESEIVPLVDISLTTFVYNRFIKRSFLEDNRIVRICCFFLEISMSTFSNNR